MIALITLIITVVSLLPSFRGAEYAKDALELARWTARKDYIEACHEVSDSKRPSGFLDLYNLSLMPILKHLNRSSIDCQQALEEGVAPPPSHRLKMDRTPLFTENFYESDKFPSWTRGVRGVNFWPLEGNVPTCESLGEGEEGKVRQCPNVSCADLIGTTSGQRINLLIISAEGGCG